MSILRFSLILTLAVSGTASLHAGATEPTATSPKFELKKRSSFALPETTRPPFWPIGWTKRVAGKTEDAVVAGPKIVLDERNFQVTSILLGSPSLAVINGRSYSEGEFVRMPRGATPMRVRVQRISDGAVELQFENQVIFAKLRRDQLEQKKGGDEELLLLDDR